MSQDKTVLDLLPSARSRNPELVEHMLEGEAVKPEKLPATRPKKVAQAAAVATLTRVPIEEEVKPRKIRISMHVTREKHYLVRKGAAELNMSVDAFLAEAVDAALRGLALLP